MAILGWTPCDLASGLLRSEHKQLAPAGPLPMAATLLQHWRDGGTLRLLEAGRHGASWKILQELAAASTEPGTRVLATIRTTRPITTNIVLDFDILIKQQFQKRKEKTPSEKELKDQSRKNPKYKIVQQLTITGIDDCNSVQNSTTTVQLIKAKLLWYSKATMVVLYSSPAAYSDRGSLVPPS